MYVFFFGWFIMYLDKNEKIRKYENVFKNVNICFL